MLEQLTIHRRALHRIPELDDQLPETQAYLLDRLSPLRCRIITRAAVPCWPILTRANRIPPLFAVIWMRCP